MSVGRPWFGRVWPYAVGVALLLFMAAGWAFYPSDRTPKGAYYRVVIAVNRGEPELIFPYIETAAQHAAFTIGNYQRDARKRIEAAFPEPIRSQELSRLSELSQLEPGPAVFAWYAEKLGWVQKLRADLSGAKSVEVEGERATVETARGTRYTFRQRDNGMWGLTLFTARLVADSEKAARDFAQIDAAAKDYEAVQAQPRR